MAHEGSYVRWQSIAIDQLSRGVSLILSFATASLGFALALIRDQSYAPDCWGKVFMGASVPSLMFSILFGIWCVINRLVDFRKTRNIAQEREELERTRVAKDEIDNRLRARRSETATLGTRSWRLFWCQIGTFAFGTLALAIALAIVYHAKLF